MIKQITAFAVLVAMVAAVGCKEEPAAPASTPQASAAALPADLLATAAPQGAKAVNDVRASARDGDQVIIRGIVGGRTDPIAANRAVFTIVDPALPLCGADDACKTPWDACCEPTGEIAASSATVQVVDASGSPLKAGLAGLGGLAPLKQVIITGQYRPSPDGKAVTINAQSLYVVP